MKSPQFKLLAELALSALLGISASWTGYAGQDLDIRTISSRPDAVSGGDVLVQVNPPIDSKWNAQLDGRDVTQAFKAVNGSGTLLALLTGLKPGKNLLVISVNGAIRSTLAILNHSLAGPIFSGPHQKPFICQTVINGLGPALDADCTAKTVVQYYYKSTEPVQPAALIKAANDAAPKSLLPGFKTYDPSSSPPADVAQTVTSDGRTVPYIVRREIGTLNRAVYEIKFLHQPGQPLPTPWTRRNAGWNGRLVYSFGGGCGAGYHQGTLESFIGDDAGLAQGYAVVTSTLNVFGNNCNDELSAETVSMVKEHFIKQYGEPVHTIGLGGSGGSMQVHLIAQNHPGLLDGIIPFGSFPDVVTTVQSKADCSLLTHAFETSKRAWTEEQKSAVSGFANWRVCDSWMGEGFFGPKDCDPSIPKERVYDRIANVGGARCTVYDNEINVFGRDPHTGFAYRPLENVGVQYGLLAFNSGRIDTEQFIELNKLIGGHDVDGEITGTRTAADPEALRIAYQRGLVLTGGGGLAQVPIIDWRAYSDDLGDKHDLFRSFVTRARLLSSNGTAGNHVILIDPRYDFYLLLGGWRGVSTVVEEGLRKLVPQMDRWLDAVAADSAAGTPAAKVARNKPAYLADGCMKTDGGKIVEPAIYDGSGKCNQLYPPHADPRIAAGGPLTDDILKCALKPVTPADYSHPLSPDQLRRLRALFPSGVCDYSRPGIRSSSSGSTARSSMADGIRSRAESGRRASVGVGRPGRRR